MALAQLNLITILPSSCCCCGKSKTNLDMKRLVGFGFGNGRCCGVGHSGCFSVSRVLRSRVLGARPWELNAIDTHIVENAPSPATATTATVEIPVTCFQLVGVADKAEKDEIVKSVMQLKNAEVEEGYTLDAVTSRQDLLMDVRDKLLFEPEYAGNAKEKIPPKSSLRIPWPWLPGALCLLQEAPAPIARLFLAIILDEVGAEKLVLDIGQAALKHPDAKPYIHDVLLSMALAECAIAKINFEKNKVSNGFEALARAQCLLRSKISLGKMELLSQIEESLEELAPACTLELLGMPHSPEHVERRRGAIAALRELVRQGLDVEISCRVQDWQCFLSQALNRLMATEIVDLLPWEDLAIMRKNKKSIESHNQRVVIEFNCFYVVLIAHAALGFSSKQMDLINKAKVICECLMTSEGIDLKFEEAFCLFLLGQGSEAQAVEKLHQLELNSNSAGRSLVPVKEIDFSSGKPSLETWLKEAVLTVFPDTRDCSPSFVNFFSGEKRNLSSKKRIHTPQTNSSVARRSLSDIAVKRMDCEESVPRAKPSQNLGFAVKQLAPTNLQSSLIVGTSDSGDHEPSAQLKRNIGVHHRSAWQSWLFHRAAVGKIIIVAAVGCVVFSPFNLSRRLRISSKLSSKHGADVSSLIRETDSTLDYAVGPSTKQTSINKALKKLLMAVKTCFRNGSKSLPISEVSDGMSSSMTVVFRKQMPVEEAEALVKQWQAIKAESLGHSHQVSSLSEILDESMLSQWQALAVAAKARSCYWRFVLLQLSVIQADIISVGIGVEMAEIEALIEEAAELVDESLQKNPNYYGTYKVRYVLKRQDDGLWRFCDCVIQSP